MSPSSKQKQIKKLLYVDLFCGAGGTSTGVERASIDGRKCASVIACVNHDPHAIASHAANHPKAVHYTEDIPHAVTFPSRTTKNSHNSSRV